MADPVLTAEREQLRRSRDYLSLMREDVLSLEAMAGDRVSQEYLKAELYHRAEALKDLPDPPLFFGRLDYATPTTHPETGHPETGHPETGHPETGYSETGISDDGVAGHSFHIGRRHVHAPDGTPAVIDWRAPVSRPFYRASAADPMNLALRRRFGFSGGELTAYEDEPFTTDRSAKEEFDAKPSQILIDEIERPRSGPMRDIVATIQPDQDDIVRADAAQTVCVQGA
ncbi:MAG TPA: AAA family ATPase, partial [Streptosporangiaceae bacterium]|nr:AAA family ATPase [Streptosporangiaceae bacterium]